MKYLITLILGFAGFTAVGEPQPMRLSQESNPIDVVLSCKSDEIALLNYKSTKQDSESEYKISVKCVPSVCKAIRTKNKIGVYKYALDGKYAVSGLTLLSGLEGDKRQALEEAEKFKRQGVCKSVEYQYSSPPSILDRL
jgi:hypothetical protein